MAKYDFHYGGELKLLTSLACLAYQKSGATIITIDITVELFFTCFKQLIKILDEKVKLVVLGN